MSADEIVRSIINAETYLTCPKCGRSEEYDAAKASGWLIDFRPDWAVIRCPDHATTYAAAAALGRSRSPRKTATARENGKKGGRPSKAFRDATLILAGKLDGDYEAAVQLIHDRLAENGEDSDLRAWVKLGSWRGDETPTSVFWEWVEYDRSQPE